jgi:hypothetical protein
VRALPVIAALAGCAEPAIELELKLPASATIPQSFDLKCVTAIDLVAMAENAEQMDIGVQFDLDRKRPPCVDLSRPPENFTDIRNAMRGQFDLPIPAEGLLGIQIRGRIGACDDEDLFHEAIFYGGATYRGGDALTVPLAANISCNTRRDYKVRPVDLIALTKTKACPAPVTTGFVFAGDVRPTLLAPELDPLMFENGTAIAVPSNGSAVVGSYTNMGTGSCVAMAYSRDDQIGATCINAGAPTVCGMVDEVEVPTAPGLFLESSTDGELAVKYGFPTFVAVWDVLPAKAPIAGATVTLPDPQHGQVVYLDLTDTRFTSRAGSTGPAGVLAVYVDRVTEIIVSAPGHSSRKMLVGGSPQLFGTAIAVLNKI